ncbi:hypothetical protein H257_06553 [Aphanomyces astaci]|uniref:Uncharacterized protein n=1 Tax=Aphanomyces astaci TaxID=112090 RepID=W4GME5_APHAT|nr:hypothetical protein H257_06553 [Aphanomyces astaci]ETV80194.1 hypothetical protein H257_06553 [Aphanomyces astaci]|eukprot:XP_009830118.1 hypothetical protein H257_06553 [Aphanomyces astaci]
MTVVAVALRLFDASVAVATCKLNPFSDEPTALTRKVRDSMQLMQSFNVSLELPHHCHHILGGGSTLAWVKSPIKRSSIALKRPTWPNGAGSCRGGATTAGRCHVPVCPE